MSRRALNSMLIEQAIDRRQRERRTVDRRDELCRLVEGSEARRIASSPNGLGWRLNDPRLAQLAQIEVQNLPGLGGRKIIAVDSRGNVLAEKEIT